MGLKEIKKSKQALNKRWIIVLGIVLLCMVFGLLIGIKKYNGNVVKDNFEEQISKDDNEKDRPPIMERDYILLAAVPVESILLRETPGFGKDIVKELKPGTYLKWYGETTEVDGTEFFKVIVRDTGEEGYLAARYCVKVEFDYQDELTIVETDTALYTYDMMLEDIKTLCDKYSNCLKDRVIGHSADGREIHEIVLGNPNADNHVMLQAGIHGREYMTSQLVMKMLEFYAYYYEDGHFEGTYYKDIFEKTAFHVVTMSNPDGVTISQLGVDALKDSAYADIVYECYERDKTTLTCEKDANGDMNWNDYYRQPGYEKGNTKVITFEEYQKIWKANARGVDLNNNFDADWENVSLKKYPAYGSYKGDYALSESESRALVELAYEYDYRCFLSYHSRGQVIYYDVAGNTPENSQASSDLANLLDDWIKYESVKTIGAHNVNLGGFGDWVQLKLSKPSVTIESGRSPCPLEISEFASMWHRHCESWAMLGKQFMTESDDAPKSVQDISADSESTEKMETAKEDNKENVDGAQKSKQDANENAANVSGKYLVVIDAGHQAKGNSEKEPVEEDLKMAEEEYQEKIAVGIANGIDEYFLTQ